MIKIKVPIAGHENDQIIIAKRRHWASMVGVIVITLILIALPLALMQVIRIVNPDFLTGSFLTIINVIGSIYYLVMTTFAFSQWINYYYDILIVTDNEVIDIDQNGLFDRHISEISLLRIQDVSARVKGFWPTLFNYGDVVAESAGENTRTYIISSIPDPINVANKILDLHNEHIARDGRENELGTGEGDLRPQQTSNIAKMPVYANSQNESQNNNVCPPCVEPVNSLPTTQLDQETRDSVSNSSSNSDREIKF
jgi:hypothetical protein